LFPCAFVCPLDVDEVEPLSSILSKKLSE